MAFGSFLYLWLHTSLSYKYNTYIGLAGFNIEKKNICVLSGGITIMIHLPRVITAVINGHDGYYEVLKSCHRRTRRREKKEDDIHGGHGHEPYPWWSLCTHHQCITDVKTCRNPPCKIHGREREIQGSSRLLLRAWPRPWRLPACVFRAFALILLVTQNLL